MTNYEEKYHKYKKKYLNTHFFSFKDPVGHPLMQQIINGIKTVEGRKNSEVYQKVKVGDRIVMKTAKETKEGEIVCLVKAIRKYPDIKTYLEKEMSKALPGVSSISEGLHIYHTFVSDDEISKLNKVFGNGFIAFEIVYLHTKTK